MQTWELAAREAIRDLVARYNANGDAGRFAQVLELFAGDAVMTVDGGHVSHGVDEIAQIFSGAARLVAANADDSPRYVRHFTSTHQIDLVDGEHATGRCYFQVLTAIGLDHWGRYVDEYRVVDGRWRFAARSATVDGHSPESLFTAG